MATRPPRPMVTKEEKGVKFGKYMKFGVVGKGSFAEVYRGTHTVRKQAKSMLKWQNILTTSIGWLPHCDQVCTCLKTTGQAQAELVL
jgi:hypothetical protein